MLSLLNRGTPPKPKFTMRPPAWYWFVVFVLLGSVWIAASFQPFDQIPQTLSRDSSASLVVVDTSASVSRFVTSSKWKKEMESVVASLGKTGTVYGCSGVFDSLESVRHHVGDVQELGSTKAVAEFSRGLRFDSQAPNLKTLIPACLGAVDGAANVVVIGDQDAYSWRGVLLKGLMLGRNFFVHDLSDQKTSSKNSYFETVEALPQRGEMRRWEIRLKANSLKAGVVGSSPSLQEVGVGGGKLQLIAGQTQDQSSFAVVSEKKVSVDAGSIQFEIEQSSIPPGKHLAFRFLPTDSDSIGLDDLHWVGVSANQKTLRLYTDTDDETWIHARTRHFQAYWQSMGNRWLYGKGSDSLAQDLSVLLVEDGLSGDVCSTKTTGKIWLAPVSEDQSYDGLCKCFASLTDQKLPCKGLGGVGEWQDIILSSGGKQIGGDVGAASSTRLLRYNRKSQDILLVLTPLRPGKLLELTAFPRFIRSLVGWHLNGQSGATGLSESDTGPSLQLANVPKEESASENHFFSTQKINVPRWSEFQEGTRSADTAGAVVQVRDDTLWSSMFLFVFLAVLACEALGLFSKSLRRMFLVLPLLLLVWPLSTVRAASTVFSLKSSVKANFKRIPALISSRTSMHINPLHQNWKKLPTRMVEPLVWSSTKNFAAAWRRSRSTGKTHRLKQWLQKGGTAVLHYNSGSLDALKESVAADIKGGTWAPLGVDHEISKSYYLFSGLPSCGQNLLHEFRVDGRMVLLLTPLDLIRSIEDDSFAGCSGSRESWKRLFVNIWMGLLAMDYKKDQVHLPEILKRLR
jgi:hypothetical protein